MATRPPTRNSSPAGPLAKRFTLQRTVERLIRSALFLCAMLSVVTTLGIVIALLAETVLP
ncbi:MAG: hypothetical protein JNG89_02660, partial [Planctomycetaceae bacterium]|nr:hypothetical protein [Planctomycetaceae bacterium]